VTTSYRNSFIGGLLLALIVGARLFVLWQPQHQIQLHSEHLLDAMADKDWKRVGEFIAPDYQDQWHNDRERLLERTRAVFGYLRNVRFTVAEPIAFERHWQARITVDGDANELMSEIESRVNSVSTPFDLEWRQMSSKPWDWQLVRVTNSGLTIPELGD
jgi:hypothetical protein